MKKIELVQAIAKKRSCLCVGLDPDLNKLPKHLLSHTNPIASFNKEIIEATSDYCVAYKPNLAFFEAAGVKGWEALELTVNEYIPQNIFKIADAKRGDLGNSSKMYAKSVFENFNFDAVTVSPYMGLDSIEPFLQYEDKWVIVLALTSNPGSSDLQKIQTEHGELLFERVLKRFKGAGNIMFVVGATQGDAIKRIRSIIPEHFLLIPGIGAQGGNLEEACKYGFNEDCGVLINSSRSIIYSSSEQNFAQAAQESAKALQKKMELLLDKHNKALIS